MTEPLRLMIVGAHPDDVEYFVDGQHDIGLKRLRALKEITHAKHHRIAGEGHYLWHHIGYAQKKTGVLDQLGCGPMVRVVVASAVSYEHIRGKLPDGGDETFAQNETGHQFTVGFVPDRNLRAQLSCCCVGLLQAAGGELFGGHCVVSFR